MSIFQLETSNSLGTVLSVDTSTVLVQVTDTERLRQLQVNRLAVLQSSRPGQHLIGIVQKISRSMQGAPRGVVSDNDEQDDTVSNELNVVRIGLIGTFVDKRGSRTNVFLRTLETVPDIDAHCFSLEGELLTQFMRIVSTVSGDGHKLSLGHYTLDQEAVAYINGNKFFQRHATIVGSTGSGKSWTTGRLLEQVALLPQANAIVFDIHGEYGTLTGRGFRHLRVAGPADIGSGAGLASGLLHLPYWLLGYEALLSMFIDRTDQNAPNQAMVIAREVTVAKQEFLRRESQVEILENFTIDSPVPFDLSKVLSHLRALNEEMVPGTGAKEKQGDYFGKLSRMIGRLEAKSSDRRLGFLFKPSAEAMKLSWLEELTRTLMCGSRDQNGEDGGVKVLDFSEVPSDILPLMVSLVARLVFTVQQWTAASGRRPVALFCDEAHLYVPEKNSADASGQVSLDVFERIAKEGRKYGVALVIVSQRPSEVNRTVLSQCNNLIAMRLTNGEDQAVIRRLLPDSLGGFGDLLPILDIGEALVVGDASLLPSRIRIEEPTCKPNSGTIDFWDRWSDPTPLGDHALAVSSWRKQSLR